MGGFSPILGTRYLIIISILMTTPTVFGDRCASTGDYEGHLGVTYLRPNLPDVVSSGYGCTLALMVCPALFAFGVDKGHV